MKGGQNKSEKRYAFIVFATVLIISIFSVLTPFSFFLIIFLPLPLMIAYQNISNRTCFILVMSCFICFLLIFDSAFGIFLGVYTFGLGIIYGSLSYQKASAFQVVKSGSIFMILSFTVLIAFMEIFYDIAFFSELELMVKEAVNIQVNYLQELNAPASQTEEMKEMPEFYSEQIVPLLPSILIISATAIAILQYLLGFKLFEKLGRKIESFTPFIFWRLPGYFAFIFVVSLLAMLFIGDNESMAGMFFLNLFYILTYGLLVQGAALIYWFMREKNIGKILSALGIIMLLILPPLSFIIIAAGVFDLAFNFRKV